MRQLLSLFIFMASFRTSAALLDVGCLVLPFCISSDAAFTPTTSQVWRYLWIMGGRGLNLKTVITLTK